MGRVRVRDLVAFVYDDLSQRANLDGGRLVGQLKMLLALTSGVHRRLQFQALGLFSRQLNRYVVIAGLWRETESLRVSRTMTVGKSRRSWRFFVVRRISRLEPRIVSEKVDIVLLVSTELYELQLLPYVNMLLYFFSTTFIFGGLLFLILV